MTSDVTLTNSIDNTEICFLESVKVIDGHLGKGYAKKHPILLGAFMQAAIIDWAAKWISDDLADVVTAVRDYA